MGGGTHVYLGAKRLNQMIVKSRHWQPVAPGQEREQWMPGRRTGSGGLQLRMRETPGLRQCEARWHLVLGP